MKKQTQYSISEKMRVKTFAVSFAIFVGSMGCKKFLMIPPPQTQLVTASVYANNATATSVQTNIYTLMWNGSDSYNISSVMGLYSDELKNYLNNSGRIQIYTNSLLAAPALGATYGPWGLTHFKYIYTTNALIEGLQNTAGCSAPVKQQLTGEAYFIRAFWHFYMTNIYGDVPLILSTDYSINNSSDRSSRIQVLQQVINDLHVAQNLLNSSYVDNSDTTITAQRVRPNKAAATALLARAYLYLGDYSGQNATYYQKADSAATAVIANNNYSLTSLNNVFSSTSQEAIWQIQTPSPESTDTNDGNGYILTGAPSTTSNNKNTTISTQLLGAFETGDQRLINWIGTYTTTGNVTYKYSYKYKGNSLNYSTTAGLEYNTVLRLGEVYLIRAEARTHEGNTTGAVADLNVIRNRAGLASYAGATDQTSLLTAILHERQVELFTEWGHRWFDLCRTGKAPSVMGAPGNVCQAKGGTWASDNHQLLFPIPQSDILINSNLTQNPGY